jgi:hypothetical protein
MLLKLLWTPPAGIYALPLKLGHVSRVLFYSFLERGKSFPLIATKYALPFLHLTNARVFEISCVSAFLPYSIGCVLFAG